ncbi:MAG: trypsin-like peptidase domain-containing protein [Pseudomonadota bacterium]
METTAWRKTLERIAPSVISIRVDGTRAFDTSWNQSSQATGFVVDAERGLVLTNRHVVTAGPVVAEAIFINNEEVSLQPVYRDPVHDFGFFRFNPEALRYLEPEALALNSANAQIGREIRVVGNDAGEQLSILAGTLAKLDRQAPSYGRGNYNDFNTFYLQAASGTSGGSSGSPVLDVNGDVVALNAGANSQAASSFFLPLDRIERALSLIQAGEPVTRGTLQTVFVHRPYDELRRLGLREATESVAREAFPDQTGMLVVAEVVRGGPGDGVLMPGDILVGINNELITRFVPLEATLDDSVGESIAIDLERGGQPMTVSIAVDDLHSITPAEYIEAGGSVLHQLSYQQARHFNREVTGIYVAKPGYMLSTGGIPRGAVIESLDGMPTATLDDLENALDQLGDRDRAIVRFYTVEDPRSAKVRVIRMDRAWFPAQRCGRDDVSGIWPCRALANVDPSDSLVPGSTQFTTNGDSRVAKLAPSLVMVNFDMPYPMSGVSELHYHGTGVIADAERGLVVVDKNTVPVQLGDVSLTFAGSLEIPGKVVYIHPTHNLAVLQYDPALIGDTPVQSVQFSNKPVKPGDPIWVVGLKGNHKIAAQGTEVASIDAVAFPLSRTFRFRDTNLEAISLVNAPGGMDGVLADKKGRVVSLWSSFAFQGGNELQQINQGVPADLVQEMITIVRDGRMLRSIEAEFVMIPLSAARKLGLPEEWVQRLESHNPERRHVLKIVRTVAGTPSARAFSTGDLLLALDGDVVNTFREVERAVQKDTVAATVWRGAGILELDVEPVALDGNGVGHILHWAGALLHDPHRELPAQRGITPNGVYVAHFGYGTPASRYGLWAGRRVIEVDGVPVSNLEEFIGQVRDKQDRDAVRLRTVSWNDAVDVITLKLDEQYWPAYQLTRNEGGWQRTSLQ